MCIPIVFGSIMSILLSCISSEINNNCTCTVGFIACSVLNTIYHSPCSPASGKFLCIIVECYNDIRCACSLILLWKWKHRGCWCLSGDAILHYSNDPHHGPHDEVYYNNAAVYYQSAALLIQVPKFTSGRGVPVASVQSVLSCIKQVNEEIRKVGAHLTRKKTAIEEFEADTVSLKSFLKQVNMEIRKVEADLIEADTVSIKRECKCKWECCHGSWMPGPLIWNSSWGGSRSQHVMKMKSDEKILQNIGPLKLWQRETSCCAWSHQASKMAKNCFNHLLFVSPVFGIYSVV